MSVSETLRLWEHLFGEGSGYLVTFTGRQPTHPEARPNELDDTEQKSWRYPEKREDAARYLLEESSGGRDGYFGVHLFETGANRKHENAASAVRALWVDDDGAELPEGWPEPTAAVESSPGRRHRYWKLTHPLSPEEAAGLNKRLAYGMGGDKGKWGLSTVLRAPGTMNYKREEPAAVHVSHLNGDAWEPEVLEQAIPLLGGPSANGDGPQPEPGEPPVALSPEDLKAWRGERYVTKETGELDRSKTLFWIGCAVARGLRGSLLSEAAKQALVADAVAERDTALGYAKYAGRTDAGEYQKIAEKALGEAASEAGSGDTQAPGAADDTGDDAADSEEKAERRNQADRLIGYALSGARELFTDQVGAPHALVNGEPVPLNSRCYGWLRRLMWEQEEKSVAGEALKTAAGTLAAHAEFSGEVRELHTRAAFHDGALYYELSPGRVVKASTGGWELDPEPPVLFRRYQNLKPLPGPETGGSLHELERFVNLKSERDRRLYTAYAATLPLEHVGRPVLLATGVMGSGKTTASRILKRLWDPTAPETVRLDPRDFLQKASHCFMVLLDNQSGVPEWAADTLCRLVTGEADSKRRLYSDDEDVIFELRRPVLLNGINVPTERGDVLDRSLAIELDRIPDSARRTEEELWEEFEREHPRLLGAAFEVLAQALAAKPTLKLSRRPRLADWGEYAAAVYEVLGWGAEQFLTDWAEIVKVQNQATLDGSPVAQAIIKFMEDRDEYIASSSELHKKLETVAEGLGISVTRDKAWPKSARWLWRRMKEVLPLLAVVGIQAERGRENSGKQITLRKPSTGDGTDGTERETSVGMGESRADTAEPDGTSNGTDGTSNGTANPAWEWESADSADSAIRYGDFSEPGEEHGWDCLCEKCLPL